MFKNLTFFRFPPPEKIYDFFKQLDAGTLETQLKPVGPLELSSRGWIIPPEHGDQSGRNMPFVSEHFVLLTLGIEERMLPAAVINAELTKRLADVETKDGRKPGGRARKRMKDDLIHELLPRAFVKPSRLQGYLDLVRGLLVVDTASRKQAEGFVSELRHALGSFPAYPLLAPVAPRAVLTRWVSEGRTDIDGLALGDEAVLEDAADQGAVARVSRQELHSDEIAHHLEAGKQVTRLGLQLFDRLSFTIDEDLSLRKFKLLDGALDQLEGVEHDDIVAELEARFFLLTTEVATLFDLLESSLSLSGVTP